MSPGPSILYVEDDDAIAEMYRLGLERAGFVLTIAPDWAAARRLLRKRSFDLVLLDIMLPGTDGMSALEEIRSTPAGTGLKIAVLSNSDLNPEVHQRARELGVLAWMVKSKAPPPVVARSVRRWLRLPRLTGSRQEA